MRRSWICVLAVTGVLLGIGIPAKAVQGQGEICVMLDFADGEVYEGEVTLYKAGSPDGEHYVLSSDFGGGLVRRKDATSPALARWLAECAGDNGTRRILDADGTAWFSGLPEGLYLLVQSQPSEGLDPFEPFLLTLPSDGQWNPVALPQYKAVLTTPPETSQHPAPLLGAMGMILSAAGLLFCAERFRRK